MFIIDVLRLLRVFVRFYLASVVVDKKRTHLLLAAMRPDLTRSGLFLCVNVDISTLTERFRDELALKRG